MKAKKVKAESFKIGQICYDLNPESTYAMRMRFVKKDKYGIYFKPALNKKYPISQPYFISEGLIGFTIDTRKYVFRLKK